MAHTCFDINCGYHLKISYKKNVDPYSKSRSLDKVATVIHKLIFVYKDNLQYIQKPQKRFYDQDAKQQSDAPSLKVWPNMKSI